MKATDLEAAFRRHAPEAWLCGVDRDALGSWLERSQEAVAAGAVGEVNGELLGRALADAIPEDEPGLPDLQVAELYLAAAALAGHRAELAGFDRQLAAVVRGIAGRLRGTGMSADEFAQIVRERLLVGDHERPPKLASYRGAGSLLGWIRVVVGRLAIDLHREAHRPGAGARGPLPANDPRAPQIPPEVAVLIDRHGEGVRQALVRVLTELPADERRLLRLHSLEGRSFEEIAAELGIHRTSASRRWTAIRDRLAEALRRALAADLGGTETDAASLAGAFRSHVEVSLARLLRSDAKAGPDA